MLLHTMIFMTLLSACIGMISLQTLVSVRVERTHDTHLLLATLAEDAVEDLRQSVAQQQASPNLVLSHLVPAPITTMLPLCGAANTCSLKLEEIFTEDAPKLSSADNVIIKDTKHCASAAVDMQASYGLACQLESDSAITEGRRQVQVVIRLSSADGMELGSTTRIVRLRTLALPPYAIVVGIYDPHSALRGAGVGDIGGFTADPTQSDTLIHSYAPCRHVPAGANVSASDGKNWNTWTGPPAGPAIEARCDVGAGETSQYIDLPYTNPKSSNAWLP